MVPALPLVASARLRTVKHGTALTTPVPGSSLWEQSWRLIRRSGLATALLERRDLFALVLPCPERGELSTHGFEVAA